jgi:uncharacterized protein (TIGR00369 family)
VTFPMRGWATFLVRVGAKREHVADGRALVSVKPAPELLGNHDDAPNGLLMTLLEAAMAEAALSRNRFASELATVDMHVTFLRPARGGLSATGRTTGGGRSVCFCEATLEDGDGQVVARALGTFRYRDPASTSQTPIC